MTNIRWFSRVVLSCGLLACSGTLAYAQPSLFSPAPPVAAAAPATNTLTQQQIEELVAPYALYPDPLLAQILPACTYPNDVASAAQWLAANPNPPQAAIDAQAWDPSIKALIHYPTVLQRMATAPDQTQALGAAFINQQADVMAAIQTLRAQAQSAGVLNSTPQQQVTTTDGAIDIEPADPNVIYVPVYNPIYTDGYWGWDGGISFGLGYPLGIWLGNDFDWHHHWIDVGVGWNTGWRGRWWGAHGRGLPNPEVRGRIVGPHAWARDNARPGPVLPPAFRHGPVVDERRGFAPAVAHPEPARAGTFGPVNNRAAVERASARGRASRAPARPPEPARAPEPARPVERAPAPAREAPAREAPARAAPPREAPAPSAFHASAPGHTVQQQSARGNASRGRH